MRSSIDPWRACLCRLEAASVTASASWSARAAGNSSRLASASGGAAAGGGGAGILDPQPAHVPGAWAVSDRFNATT